jgi:hypothetical protein
MGDRNATARRPSSWKTIIAGPAIAATLLLAGAGTAAADPQTVTFHSLKLVEKSGRLIFSAKDPTIPFPDASTYFNPDVNG